MQDKFIKNTTYIVIGILLFTFILIQPYNLICKVKKSCQPITLSSLPFYKTGQQKMSVNFGAIIPDDLKLTIDFYPNKHNIVALNGRHIKDLYVVENLTKNKINVSVSFDVIPKEAEKYIEKTECLCSKSYPLNANQTSPMNIDLRINPEIEKDPNFVNLKEITIIYTAHLVE